MIAILQLLGLNILIAQLTGVNHWSIDLRNMEVEDQEGWVNDKPYMVQIGYSVQLGKNCSVYTELINGPFFADSKYKQDVDYQIPKSVGMMQFPGLKDPPAFNKTGNALLDLIQLGPTVNFINNNGLTIYGTIIIAMRDGKLMSADEQKLIFEALRMDLHSLLEEVVANPNIFSGQVNASNVELKIRGALASFFSTTGKIISKGTKGLVGFRENIVGFHIIMIANVAQNLVNSIETALLPYVRDYISNQILNDFKYEVTIKPEKFKIFGQQQSTVVNINLEPLGNISTLKNFTIGYIDIDAINWWGALAIDGRFSVSATIGGTGNYQFYQNQFEPLRFRLLKENSNSVKAVYDITGAINKSVTYIPEANHVNPSECIDYCIPQKIVNDFSFAGGYTDAGIYPRMFADVDGDGRLDIVGFSNNGVRVSLNRGSFFQNPLTAINQFTVRQGYIDNNRHPRIVKDINNDGRADIVGFGPNGLQIALGTTSGTFTNFRTISTDFTQKRPYQADWPDAWDSFHNYPRFVEDMNGDGWPDIVGFGKNAVWVVLNNNGFSTFNFSYNWVPNFTKDYGWLNANSHMRLIADMNNDGKADIVGFGNNGVLVSLTNSSGIGASNPVLWSSEFGHSNGWVLNETYPRFLKDMNNDGYLDVVGFGYYDTKVAINNNGASLRNAEAWSTEFGTFEGWGDYQSHPKFVGDINGDGFQDFISIGANSILVGQGDGQKIRSHKYLQSLDLKNYVSYSIPISGLGTYNLELPASQSILPKELINYDKSDNREELVIFANDGVYAINCSSQWNAFRLAQTETYAIEDKSDISINPNPSAGIFTIHAATTHYSVYVYDAMSRLVHTHESFENKSVIDLSDRNYSGLFLVTVIDDNNSVYTKKIILK